MVNLVSIQGGLQQFFGDSVVSTMIACHTSVLIMHAKIMQVTLRKNENHFSTWKTLNHFSIGSSSFKLRSNMFLSLEPKQYGKNLRIKKI